MARRPSWAGARPPAGIRPGRDGRRPGSLRRGTARPSRPASPSSPSTRPRSGKSDRARRRRRGRRGPPGSGFDRPAPAPAWAHGPACRSGSPRRRSHHGRRDGSWHRCEGLVERRWHPSCGNSLTARARQCGRVTGLVAGGAQVARRLHRRGRRFETGRLHQDPALLPLSPAPRFNPGWQSRRAPPGCRPAQGAGSPRPGTRIRSARARPRAAGVARPPSDRASRCPTASGRGGRP